MRAIVFDAPRTGYGIDQIENPMTVRELREMLESLDDNTTVIMSHDNGYTYGSISRYAGIREETEGEYGTEWEEIDEIWA